MSGQFSWFRPIEEYNGCARRRAGRCCLQMTDGSSISSVHGEMAKPDTTPADPSRKTCFGISAPRQSACALIAAEPVMLTCCQKRGHRRAESQEEKLLCKKWIFGSPFLLLLGATVCTQSPSLRSRLIPPGKEVATSVRHNSVQTYGKLPLAFEANEGQSGDSVKFLARTGGHTLFLTATEAVLSLRKQDVREIGDDRKREAPVKHLRPDPIGVISPKPPSENRSQTAVVRMKLIGANPNARISGLEQLPGKSNYLIGNDPAKWRTNVPNFARVKYQDVYPGIDLVYYGNQGQLEYDFLVSPGADPSVIQLTFEGQEKLGVDSAGSLVLETGAEAISASTSP